MKKNTKGFTLIELLAVIVILAIIALIATPIVLNIIKDTRESAVLSSAKNYLHAVDLAVMDENLKKEFKPTTCTVLSNGNLNCVGYQDEIQIKMKGQKPNSGTISFASKKIDTATLYISDYIVELNNNEYTIRKSETSNKSTIEYKEGDVVYFNVDEGGKCDNYTEAQSAAGVRSGCMKFYVLKVYDDSLDLILDHNTNTSDGFDWYYDEHHPAAILGALYGSTYKWKGTITPENYTGTLYGGETYTIDYTEFYDTIAGIKTGPFKARLPEIEEIVVKLEVFQNLTPEEKENWMILYDYAMKQYNNDLSIPTWLTANLEPDTFYWTATVNKTKQEQHANSVWIVGKEQQGLGVILSKSSDHDYYGIRPVIKVLKSTVENKGMASEQEGNKQEPLKAVYFDVTNGTVCESEDATGISSGCMKFYLLNKTSERATLILDHDIAEQIEWCENCYNYKPESLLSELQTVTSSWNGVLPLENYTAPNGMIIDYANYKARIPTFEELIIHTQWYKKLEDKTSISEKYQTEYLKFNQELLFEYYLNNLTEEQGFEYMKKANIALPPELQTNKSYWTATPYVLNSQGYVAYLVNSSIIANADGTTWEGMNLRPVIEISADLVD